MIHVFESPSALITYELLGRADIPGGGEMTLERRNGEYAILADGYELMTSRVHFSEERLAREAFSRADCQRVLIGGLGMGFTLRAALDALGPEAEVVVAELVPEVLDWNLGPLGKLAHYPLRDPRTCVYVGDVFDMISLTDHWDAILLDVDNGAQAFTKEDNQELYEDDGLDRLRESLRRGVILVVWSYNPNQRFEKRLKRAKFRNETLRIIERQGKFKLYHYLFIARRNLNSED